MKKLIAVLLALCLCAGLIPAAFAAETPIDPEEFPVLGRKVYAANKTDTLFSKHKSLTLNCHFSDGSNPDGLIYWTADGEYNQTGGEQAFYLKGRTIYVMIYDEETGDMDCQCAVNVNPDTTPRTIFVAETEEEFVALEHEELLALYEEDGRIHICTRYDETQSREFVEEMLYQEYAGQIIYDDTAVDAESYEYLQGVFTAELDGETATVYIQTVDFDLPEPMAARILRASFERDIENMMTLTVVVDPGSDHEFTESLTVPANNNFSLFYIGSSSVPMVSFDDADGTVVTHWDRMSDHTWYVFTNPDEELVERHEALVAELESAKEAAK